MTGNEYGRGIDLEITSHCHRHVPDLGAGDEMIIEVGTDKNEITVEFGTRVGDVQIPVEVHQ